MLLGSAIPGRQAGVHYARNVSITELALMMGVLFAFFYGVFRDYGEIHMLSIVDGHEYARRYQNESCGKALSMDNIVAFAYYHVLNQYIRWSVIDRAVRGQVCTLPIWVCNH
jgi:hypothetical protein